MMLSASSSSSFSAALMSSSIWPITSLGNLQLLKHLVVALKNLDGIPALLLFGQVVYSRLLNVSNGVLNATGEGVHRHGLGILGSVDSGLCAPP